MDIKSRPSNVARNTCRTIHRWIMRYDRLFALLGCTFPAAFANVEKTIFIAPSGSDVTYISERRALAALNIETLSPGSNTLRRAISRTGTSRESSVVTSTWYSLTDLNPAQRYEVRICWAATVSLSDLSSKPSHHFIFFPLKVSISSLGTSN